MIDGPSPIRLADLSDRFGLELKGDGQHEIRGVGTLKKAGPGDISFLSNRLYRQQLEETRAGAVILKPGDAPRCPVNCLLADDPYVSYARVAALFDTKSFITPGIHASAVIDESARVAEQVHVAANAVIGPGAVIETGASIGAGTVLGPNCRVGAGSRLEANVTVADNVRIGQRVLVHSGAVIGADGFGLAFAGDHWEKVPQLGSVVIGDDCEIGANTTIDRGAIEDTILEEDVRIDNQVQIAHNVYIGAHTAIAGCVGISGSSRIGRNCLLAGRSALHGHIEIADGVTVCANSEVDRDITEKGSTWGANLPAMPMRSWQRNLVHIRKLSDIVKRIRKLERKSGESQTND